MELISQIGLAWGLPRPQRTGPVSFLNYHFASHCNFLLGSFGRREFLTQSLNTQIFPWHSLLFPSIHQYLLKI